VCDLPIISVNAFGILSSLWALSVYYKYSNEMKPTVENHVLVHLFGLFVFLFCVHLGLVKQSVLSVVACASSILMYAAPLTNLRHIVESNDPGSLSPSLIGITFTVCFSWLLYGWRGGDLFVILPNLLGTLIAVLQAGLVLWCQASGKKAGLKPASSIYELLPIVNPIITSKE
jgi:solute carrier family 50 protein (sugar transporter)